MLNHTSPFTLWKTWRKPPTLPPHLPRLLLPQKYQPRFVRQCRLTQEICARYALLEWEQLPHSLCLNRRGERTIPLAAYVGTYLLKIDQQGVKVAKLSPGAAP